MLLLARDRLEAPSQGVRQRVGSIAALDQRPKGADHREDAGHVALVEQTDGEAGAGEILDDPGLEIGESKDQVGRKRPDPRRVGRGERRDPRLLAPDPRWPDDTARNADDPVFPRQGDNGSRPFSVRQTIRSGGNRRMSHARSPSARMWSAIRSLVPYRKWLAIFSE